MYIVHTYGKEDWNIPSLSVIMTVAYIVCNVTEASSVERWMVKSSGSSNTLSSFTSTLKQNSSPVANPPMVKERGVVNV